MIKEILFGHPDNLVFLVIIPIMILSTIIAYIYERRKNEK